MSSCFNLFQILFRNTGSVQTTPKLLSDKSDKVFLKQFVQKRENFKFALFDFSLVHLAQSQYQYHT